MHCTLSSTRLARTPPGQPQKPHRPQTGLEAVDVLLLLAAAENDDPKIEELIAAGADVSVSDNLGRTPKQLATKDVVVKMLADAEAKISAKA